MNIAHILMHCAAPTQILRGLCPLTLCGASWKSILLFLCFSNQYHASSKQESRAVAREPCDAAAVLFGLKFADNIQYKFKSSQASKARLQSSKRTGAKQNLTQNGHSRSRVLESVERR